MLSCFARFSRAMAPSLESARPYRTLQSYLADYAEIVSDEIAYELEREASVVSACDEEGAHTAAIVDGASGVFGFMGFSTKTPES